LQSHYRSTTDFSEEALSGAENGLHNLQQALLLIDGAANGTGDAYPLEELRLSVESKMNDDFNTAQSIAVLFEELKEIRKQINNGQTPANIETVSKFLHDFVDGVLGLWPEADNKQKSDDKTGVLAKLLIDLRNEARQNKNFELADAIRDRLADAGIELMDGSEGTAFKIKESH